ncbi:hypothetical protein CPB85DRAFT_1260079 [Mucidula mucida]|nr:hypothetical protein CPB85DRAFT_1260079 [Mucidula mucida]
MVRDSTNYLASVGSLAFVLVRSRTGTRSTEKVVNRLIRGAVQTGFFATLFALGDTLSFLFANNTALHGFFVYPIGRIYTNTLLDSLNSRKKLRRELSIGLTQELRIDTEGRSRNKMYNLSILDTMYYNEERRSREVVFARPTPPEIGDTDLDLLQQGASSSITKN